MNSITDYQALQALYRAGFQEMEIERLYWFRQYYRPGALDRPPLDLCRLQFVRWLVMTGRLSDYFPDNLPAYAAPSQEKWPRY